MSDINAKTPLLVLSIIQVLVGIGLGIMVGRIIERYDSTDTKHDINVTRSIRGLISLTSIMIVGGLTMIMTMSQTDKINPGILLKISLIIPLLEAISLIVLGAIIEAKEPEISGDENKALLGIGAGWAVISSIIIYVILIK